MELRFFVEKILNFRPRGEWDLPVERQIPRYVLLEIIYDLLEDKDNARQRSLRAIFRYLPKAIVMALGPAQFRAVIFEKYPGKIARVIARDFPWRHPRERNVPLKNIPLVEEILAKGIEVYIPNPAEHPWTAGMRELVHDQRINAIFAVPITVGSKILVLAVDATGQQQEVGEETKCYLRRVALRIGQMEKELLHLQNLRKKERAQRCTPSKALCILGELVLDALSNQIFVIGGLSFRLAKKENDQHSQAILEQAGEAEASLAVVKQVLHDLKKAEKIDWGTFPVNDIFSALSSAAVICRPAPGMMICSDQRKLEKLLGRITALLQEKNSSPVCIRAEEGYFCFRFILKQRGLDSRPLWKLIRVAQTGNTVGYKIADLPLICSVILLTQELGGEILVEGKKIMVKIPKS